MYKQVEYGSLEKFDGLKYKISSNDYTNIKKYLDTYL